MSPVSAAYRDSVARYFRAIMARKIQKLPLYQISKLLKHCLSTTIDFSTKVMDTFKGRLRATIFESAKTVHLIFLVKRSDVMDQLKKRWPLAIVPCQNVSRINCLLYSVHYVEAVKNSSLSGYWMQIQVFYN